MLDPSTRATDLPVGLHAVKVAVLMGGPSGEHAISLKSGAGVAEALRRRGAAVTPITIPATVHGDTAIAWTTEALRVASPDAVFIALHGTFGEDGTIQQLCDSLRLAYTGSDAATSRLGMNKLASKRCFEAAGLAVPRGTALDLSKTREVPSIGEPAYPLVVKPVAEGSSLGVSVVTRPQDLPAAIRAAGRFGSHVLLEAFVVGRELTVGVLGDESLPVVEIKPHQAFFDFSAKYTAGLTDYLVPAPLSPAVGRAVQATGLAAHRALGCRHLSRTDLILTPDDVPMVLEVNTIPGFTPTSLLPKAAACAGVSYDEVCERLIRMALEDAGQTRHRRVPHGGRAAEAKPIVSHA